MAKKAIKSATAGEELLILSDNATSCQNLVQYLTDLGAQRVGDVWCHDASAGTAQQEPWVFGPEALHIIRHHVRLRYKMLPYVVTVVVLVIVARHIDLSVGSVMGFVGVLIATLMYTRGWHWVEASLAGLAVGMLRGQTLSDTLRLATAAAAANALNIETGRVHIEDVHALLPQVKLRQMPAW